MKLSRSLVFFSPFRNLRNTFEFFFDLGGSILMNCFSFVLGMWSVQCWLCGVRMFDPRPGGWFSSYLHKGKYHWGEPPRNTRGIYPFSSKFKETQLRIFGGHQINHQIFPKFFRYDTFSYKLSFNYSVYRKNPNNLD